MRQSFGADQPVEHPMLSTGAREDRPRCICLATYSDGWIGGPTTQIAEHAFGRGPLDDKLRIVTPATV